MLKSWELGTRSVHSELSQGFSAVSARWTGSELVLGQDFREELPLVDRWKCSSFFVLHAYKSVSCMSIIPYPACL